MIKIKKLLSYIKIRCAGYISAFLSLGYYHYICIGISTVFLALSVLFINGVPRLFESLRDLFDSVIYYFAFVFSPSSSFEPSSVTLMQSWQWVEPF